MNVNFAKMAVLFLDLSYLVIHRFYATRAWARHNARDNARDVEDEVLDRHFDRTFTDSIERLRASNGADEVVIAKDCPRDQIWRRAFFPDYKASRGRSRLASNDDEALDAAFARVNDQLLPPSSLVIEADKAEADDVLAVLARCETYKDRDKVIVTGDTDMLQLIDANTHVVDVYNKNLAAGMLAFDPKQYITTKTIRGDRSDNVPPVFKRISSTVAEGLARDPIMLRRELDADEAAKRRFAMNDMLINLDNVPPSIVDAVEKALKDKR